MPVIPVFPTIVHGIEVENFKDIRDDLIDFVYSEQKKDLDGLHLSNQGGGWHSNNTYHFHENILNKVVTDTVSNYFRDNPVFVSKLTYALTGLWMNINPTGASNKAHMHPGSHLSAAFWIKLPKDSGGISFQNGLSFNCFNELMVYSNEFKEEMKLFQNYALFPGEGAMVLFPSSLYHYVEPNKSDEDRISVSFNLEFRGG